MNLGQREGLTCDLVEDLGGILHHADHIDKVHERATPQTERKTTSP